MKEITLRQIKPHKAQTYPRNVLRKIVIFLEILFLEIIIIAFLFLFFQTPWKKMQTQNQFIKKLQKRPKMITER